MIEVWMVASGQANEGLNRVKLMFDNELAARRMAGKIDEYRRSMGRSAMLANKGEIPWDDVKSAVMRTTSGALCAAAADNASRSCC